MTAKKRSHLPDDATVLDILDKLRDEFAGMQPGWNEVEELVARLHAHESGLEAEATESTFFVNLDDL